MALPITGSISMSQVNVELGRAANATISLGESAVRGLAEVASGGIGLQNLRGKANVFAFTIVSNQTNANLRTLAVNAGWNQSSPVQATINSGVNIISSSTGTPAMSVSGSFPGGVTLINNGTIVGKGGRGGHSDNWICGGSRNGLSGGTALNVTTPTSLANYGSIGGGGGGGGGGNAYNYYCDYGWDYWAGGGGGGAGFGAGGGSRHIFGGAGGLTTGGAGASGTYGNPSWMSIGGNGGGRGAAGATSPHAAGNALGGAGGAAITGNSNITYIATGTRLGPIA